MVFRHGQATGAKGNTQAGGLVAGGSRGGEARRAKGDAAAITAAADVGCPCSRLKRGSFGAQPVTLSGRPWKKATSTMR